MEGQELPGVLYLTCESLIGHSVHWYHRSLRCLRWREKMHWFWNSAEGWISDSHWLEVMDNSASLLDDLQHIVHEVLGRVKDLGTLTHSCKPCLSSEMRTFVFIYDVFIILERLRYARTWRIVPSHWSTRLRLRVASLKFLGLDSCRYTLRSKSWNELKLYGPLWRSSSSKGYT